MFHTFQRAEPKDKDKKDKDKKKNEIEAKNKEIKDKNKEINSIKAQIKKIETDAYNTAWWSKDVKSAVAAYDRARNIQKKEENVLEPMKKKYIELCTEKQNALLQNNPEYKELEAKLKELEAKLKKQKKKK